MKAIDQITLFKTIADLFAQKRVQAAFDLLAARASGWDSHEAMQADVRGPITPCFVRGLDNQLTYSGLSGLVKVVFSRVYEDASDTTAEIVFTIDATGKVFI